MPHGGTGGWDALTEPRIVPPTPRAPERPAPAASAGDDARVWGLGDGMLADPAGAGDGGRRDLGRTLAQHRYHRRALPQRDQRVDKRGVQLRPHPRPAGVHPGPANQRDGRALTIRRPSDQRLHELTGRTLYLRGLGAQGEQNTGAHQRPGAHSSPRALWVSPRHPAAPRGQNPQRFRAQPENDLHQARWALDEVTLGRKDSPAPHPLRIGPRLDLTKTSQDEVWIDSAGETLRDKRLTSQARPRTAQPVVGFSEKGTTPVAHFHSPSPRFRSGA